MRAVPSDDGVQPVSERRKLNLLFVPQIRRSIECERARRNRKCPTTIGTSTAQVKRKILESKKNFRKRPSAGRNGSHAVRPPGTCRTNTPGILETEIGGRDWTGILKKLLRILKVFGLPHELRARNFRARDIFGNRPPDTHRGVWPERKARRRVDPLLKVAAGAGDSFTFL